MSDQLFGHLVQIGSIFASVIGTTAIIVLFLTKQFSAVRKLFYDGLKDMSEKVDGKLDRIHTAFRDHEKDDQQRHIDNLEKFEDINVHLARLNSGHPDRSTRN